MTEAGNQTSGSTRPYWLPATRVSKYSALDKDLNVDVLIIGAGISGLTCAYTLSKAHVSLAVIDDGMIASGETGRTSAHLSAYLDYGFSFIKDHFGVNGVRLAVKSHSEAINYIERITRDEEISCEFKRVNAYLFADKKISELEDEAKVLDEVNELAWEWVERAPIESFDTGPALKFTEQAQFHPIKYIYGLAHAIEKHGGVIYENTRINKVHDGSPCRAITTHAFNITARDIIVATNSPFNDRVTIHTKQAQYRTYLICISIAKNQLQEALYWDTGSPYRYIRTVHSPNPDTDYVLVGGFDHRTGQDQPKKKLAELIKWTKKRFNNFDIIFEWSGQVIEPIDGLALTGKNPHDKHIYIHTGASGSGLTYGTIAGMLIPDLIFKNDSPYKNLYDPSRINMTGIGEFVKENFNTLTQYRDWVLPSKKVSRRGLCLEAQREASTSKGSSLSAVCPHLGGVVRWNPLEKTWDCPCHGSRFNENGEVINGPAPVGLKKIS